MVYVRSKSNVKQCSKINQNALTQTKKDERLVTSSFSFPDI